MTKILVDSELLERAIIALTDPEYGMTQEDRMALADNLRAAQRLLAAGFTTASHRLRCYVLIGFPKDTMDAATKRTNITDDEIAAAFDGTNFGGVDHRKLLEQGVLKRLTGYRCGHTLTMIMRGLGLTTEKDSVTKKGKRFAIEAFYSQEHSG